MARKLKWCLIRIERLDISTEENLCCVHEAVQGLEGK